jgi:hypothetical protein
MPVERWFSADAPGAAVKCIRWLVNVVSANLEEPGGQQARTPLHCAVDNGRAVAARALLELGARSTAADTTGETCAAMATRRVRRPCPSLGFLGVEVASEQSA